MKLYLLSPLLIFLLRPASATALPLRINFQADKPFYTTTATVNLKTTVINTTPKIKKDNRIILTVYDRLFYEEGVDHFKFSRKKVIFRRYWYNDLPPGTTNFEFSKDLSLTNLAEGVYPIKFVVEPADNQIFVKNSFLVLINKKQRALPVAVIWDWRRYPEVGADGDWKKADLNRGLGLPAAPGIYNQYLDSLTTNAGMKINLALPPFLLDALAEREAAAKNSRNTATSSGETAAAYFLDQLRKNTRDQNKVELLNVPYGCPSLPWLSRQGWGVDISKQVALGRKSLKTTLQLPAPPVGLLPPGLELDSGSLSYLTGRSTHYVVVKRKSLRDRPSRLKPLRLKSKTGDSLTALTNSPTVAELLARTPDDLLPAALTAFFAKRYFDSGTDITAIVALIPLTLDKPVKAERLQTLNRIIISAPWLRPETLTNLTNAMPAVDGGLKAARHRRANKDYLSRLRLTRRRLASLAAAIGSNRRYQELEKKLMTAENQIFVENNTAPGGRRLSANINKAINEIFQNIKVSFTRTITFSGHNGKIPIAIANHNNFPLRVSLDFNGNKDFLFYDDKIKKVKLNPKDNLIVYKVKAKYAGRNELRLTVRAGREKIAGGRLVIMVSDTAKYILRAISALSLIIIAALIFRRGIGVKNVKDIN